MAIKTNVQSTSVLIGFFFWIILLHAFGTQLKYQDGSFHLNSSENSSDRKMFTWRNITSFEYRKNLSAILFTEKSIRIEMIWTIISTQYFNLVWMDINRIGWHFLDGVSYNYRNIILGIHMNQTRLKTIYFIHTRISGMQKDKTEFLYFPPKWNTTISK